MAKGLRMIDVVFVQIATRLATASKMVIHSNTYELSKNIEYMQECLDEYNKAYKKLMENIDNGKQKNNN